VQTDVSVSNAPISRRLSPVFMSLHMSFDLMV